MKKTGTENTESSFKYGLIEKMLTPSIISHFRGLQVWQKSQRHESSTCALFMPIMKILVQVSHRFTVSLHPKVTFLLAAISEIGVK